MPFTRDQFIQDYGQTIADSTRGTGLLVGTVVAQAIIESMGSGSNLVGSSKLAREANNYFGIKADSKWNGPVYNINTGEETPSGTHYTVNAGFRKYPSIEASIRDYVHYLTSNPRYKEHGVFNAKTVEEQAKRLKEAGYATGSGYAELITSVYNSVKNKLGGYVKNNWIPLTLLLTGLIAGTAFYLHYKKKI
jgi:flagellar protein FlgJ